MVSLEEAVVKGLAPDRGLYMPERLPRLPEEFFRRLPEMSLPEMAVEVATALFGEDVDAEKLKALTEETLDFPIPLVKAADGKYSLELFHGHSCFSLPSARIIGICTLPGTSPVLKMISYPSLSAI